MDPGDVDTLRRIYWSCFLLECDRAAELDLPRSGVESQADEMPLPLSHAVDDPTTTAFLAEISIRRLLNRIHNSLYSQPAGLQHLQSVTIELQRQLTAWHASIPEASRPPLVLSEEGHDLEDRVCILRIRYYAATHIIHRPSLLCLAGHPDQNFAGTPTLAAAEHCVAACRTYLLHSTAMLGKRTPYLWTFVTSSLGALLVLEVARGVPGLRELAGNLKVLRGAFVERVKGWAGEEGSLGAMVRMVEAIEANREKDGSNQET